MGVTPPRVRIPASPPLLQSGDDTKIVKRLVCVLVVSSLSFFYAGCKKAEEKSQLPSEHPSVAKGMQQSWIQTPGKDRPVIIPEATRKSWSAVKILAYDKILKSGTEYTVTIGSILVLPNSTITIKVLAFVPDFVMNGKKITTASNIPKNPAAQVFIQEAGRDSWQGWLFSKYPDIHSFPHKQFDLRLVGGIPK